MANENELGILQNELSVLRQLLANSQSSMAHNIAELSYNLNLAQKKVSDLLEEQKVLNSHNASLENKLELARTANSELSTRLQNLNITHQKMQLPKTEGDYYFICTVTSELFMEPNDNLDTVMYTVTLPSSFEESIQTHLLWNPQQPPNIFRILGRKTPNLQYFNK